MAKEGPGRGGDTGVMDTLAVDELVSMEWSDVQDDDSESCNEREKSGYTQLHTVTHSGGGRGGRSNEEQILQIQYLCIYFSA